MGARSPRSTAAATAVGHLVLLALSLTGIVAMHGLASTGADGMHRSTITAAVASGPHGTPKAEPTVGHGGLPAAMSSAPGEEHDGHELMAGCVAVLLGLLVALALRRLPSGARLTGRFTITVRRSLASAARAPPHPLFLSLCVFRI
jgi:hypothetical protein